MYSQIEVILERDLLYLVDEEVLSLSEAEQISTHLTKFGMPIRAEEAFAIQGLSEERARWLVASDFWGKCLRKGEVGGAGNGVKVSADYGRDYDGGVDRDLMVVGGGVGVRTVGGYRSGFVKSSLGRCRFIVGDHRRHWGAGVAVSRYDPFNSMRYSHELSSPSRAFDGALPVYGSDFLRGVGASFESGRGWCAISAGYKNGGEERRVASAIFRERRIDGGRVMVGLMGEVGDGEDVVGLNLKCESNEVNVEAEVVKRELGAEWLVRGVVSGDGGDCLYWTFKGGDGNGGSGNLLGLQLGKRRNGFRVEARLSGELRFIANKYWESEKESKLEIRGRCRIIDGGVYVDGRVRGGSEILRGSLQFQYGGKEEHTILSALRIDVGKARKMCVAVMNGGIESSERLYSLLPTSRGYRLYSIGDESRALVYYELLPGRVKLCVERVWYRRDTEYLHPYNFSNRVSIRVEWR